MYIRHRAFSDEACQFLFSTLLVLLHLYETLVYRSLGSLGLGDLFWVGPCPEAGHGGSCFRDPTPPLPILSLLPAVTRCYSVPLKSGKKQHIKKDTQKYTKRAKRLSNWGPKRCENHDKTHFVPKCVMCVWHSKTHTILPFSLCHTTRKPQEQGPKNRRFRRCVNLHPQLTNITEKSSNWGPGGSTISHFSGHFLNFLVSGAFWDPAAPQVGTNILPNTDLSWIVPELASVLLPF